MAVMAVPGPSLSLQSAVESEIQADKDPLDEARWILW